MTSSQVIARRYSDVDINNLLAHFVDTLLDVEQELEAASDWQWDTIVRDACRKGRHDLEPTSDDDFAIDMSGDADSRIIPFARPRDPK